MIAVSVCRYREVSEGFPRLSRRAPKVLQTGPFTKVTPIVELLVIM